MSYFSGKLCLAVSLITGQFWQCNKIYIVGGIKNVKNGFRVALKSTEILSYVQHLLCYCALGAISGSVIYYCTI